MVMAYQLFSCAAVRSPILLDCYRLPSVVITAHLRATKLDTPPPMIYLQNAVHEKKLIPTSNQKDELRFYNLLWGLGFTRAHSLKFKRCLTSSAISPCHV